VVDGRQGKRYGRYCSAPIFSPDSKHIAYWAVGEDAFYLVADEAELEQFTKEELGRDPIAGPLSFTPDSRHIVFWTVTKLEWEQLRSLASSTSFFEKDYTVYEKGKGIRELESF